MEDAMTRDFTDGEMRSINRCRMFLQAECLSDDCTADGLTTYPGLQAQPPKVTSLSTIKWALVGSMTTVPATVYTRFHEQPASPDTRPVDTSRPSNLAFILRLILANALSDGDSADNRAAWYHCYLLAVPPCRERVHTTIHRHID
jgi:hypothetical protein